MSVYFYNPGKLDLRAVTLFGVNAKPNSDNPIGFFGTGFKYALAVCARIGAKVEIRIGDETWQLVTHKSDFRGKVFDSVRLCRVADGHLLELPFTTELGKNWEPWMVVRELGSNARDEGGDFCVDQTWTSGPQLKYDTVIKVTHPEIEESALTPNAVFLDKSRMMFADTSNGVEVHRSNRTGYFYYRGIRVGHNRLPSLFTYNITVKTPITEDRSMDAYHLDGIIRWTIIESNCREYIEACIHDAGAEEVKKLEHEIALGTFKPSDMFMQVVQEILDDGGMLTRNARAVFRKHKRPEPRESLNISEREHRKLRAAMAFVRAVGVQCNPDHVVVDELDVSILGMVEADTHQIVLNKLLLSRPLSVVCTTLLEECLHLYEKRSDYDRDMQDRLLELIYNAVANSDDHVVSYKGVDVDDEFPNGDVP